MFSWSKAGFPCIYPPNAIAVNGNMMHYVNQFKRINGRCKNLPPQLTPCDVTQQQDYKNERHKPNPTPPSHPLSPSPCFLSWGVCSRLQWEWEDGCGLITWQRFIFPKHCCFHLPSGLFLDFSCQKICSWCPNIHRASRQRKVVRYCLFVTEVYSFFPNI